MAPRPAEGDAAPTRLERAGELAAAASSLRPSDPNVRRGLYAGIGVVVLLGVALAIAGAVGKFPEIELELRPGWIAAAIAAMAAYLVLAAEIWRRLMGALGSRLSPLTANSIWFSSALGRYVPTSLLFPVMRMAAGDRAGVPKRVSLVSVVYEVGLSFAAALLVSAYFVVDLPELQDEPARFAILALPLIAIAALHPRFFHNVTDRALTRFGREPLPIALHERGILALTVAYGATFVLSGLSTYAIAECVYPGVGAGDFPIVAGAFAVATAASYVAFILPAGLVAREAVIVLALAPVMPAAPAVAIAVLSRILQVALEIAGAILFPLLVRRSEPRPADPRP
jgi:hypothetical protein